MFTIEDEYFDDDEEMEEADYEDDPEDSHTEVEDKEAYFMGTQSQARRRLGRNNNPYCSRPTYRNRYSQKQSPYFTPNHD